jgi:predicted DNA-binding transcriptional regulator AlpA
LSQYLQPSANPIKGNPMAHNPVSAGDPPAQCTRPAQQLVAALDYKTTAFTRLPGLTQRFGHSRGKVYLDIDSGVFVPGVAIGSNSKAWPTTELNAYALAYIRGFDKSALRELTQCILEARRRAGLP